MHPRYNAPFAENLFSADATIQRWKEITDAYANTVGDAEHFKGFSTPTAAAVATREQWTGHDVVAFLSVYTDRMSAKEAALVHVGLTSSDLVDNGMFIAVRRHSSHMADQVDRFLPELRRWLAANTIRAGRTHGQIAAPTTLQHQLQAIATPMAELSDELRDYTVYNVWKSPGPTGWAERNDLSRAADAAQAVTTGPWAVVPSTQVISRDYLLRWACLYLRLAALMENFAMLVRLGSRSEVGELREGAAATRIGSSSMPTKRNPIDSEKICGLANVVRGQFMAIASNTTLWEDRDLSNSSLERVTVPDMAATVEHMLATSLKVAKGLQFDANRASRNLNRSAVFVAQAQRVLQVVAFCGPIEAGGLIRDAMAEPGSENQNPHYLFQRGWNLIKEKYTPEIADAWHIQMVTYHNEIVGL